MAQPHRTAQRPHVLGVDDGPFDKRADRSAPIVGVAMEGPDLVEAVARTEFPVDGPDAAAFLAGWIGGLRVRPALRAVFLGGITIAGLGVVDVEALAGELDLPVLVLNRRAPSDARLVAALRAAGLEERIPLVERAPRAFPAGRLHLCAAGIEPDDARALVRGTLSKSALPEPLRLAHLIARALVDGESRGRP